MSKVVQFRKPKKPAKKTGFARQMELRDDFYGINAELRRTYPLTTEGKRENNI
jgi:hypothetical protein